MKILSRTNLKSIPPTIWMLGLVSMFMDVSSELVHSLLPVFMVSTLGASVTSLGFIEGIAEATAMITKIFSGVLSDYFGKRKLLALIGYSLAAFTKPLFPLANSVGLVFTARFIDRIGKGIRGAPRDALIGDIAPAEIRGACFGLRQSLDTVGALIGPILAIILMFLFAGDIRIILWIAVIPAFIAVTILFFGVKEPKEYLAGKVLTPIHIRDIRSFSRAYWLLVIISAILTLARFSEAFLILKAQATGLSIALIPIVLVVMNIAYTLTAYPAGVLSDKLNRCNILIIGILFLIMADVTLALTNNLWMLALGVSFWGLHMGFTQGLLAAMVTDSTPPHLRGTAYGVFNFVSGIAMLLASVTAGVLWDDYGANATFMAGAAFAAIAAIVLYIYNRWLINS